MTAARVSTQAALGGTAPVNPDTLLAGSKAPRLIRILPVQRVARNRPASVPCRPAEPNQEGSRGYTNPSRTQVGTRSFRPLPLEPTGSRPIATRQFASPSSRSASSCSWLPASFSITSGQPPRKMLLAAPWTRSIPPSRSPRSLHPREPRLLPCRRTRQGSEPNVSRLANRYGMTTSGHNALYFAGLTYADLDQQAQKLT